jgi:hypothetical protein
MGIAKLGIELEGFWSNDRALGSIRDNYLVTLPRERRGMRHGDGSVHLDREDLSEDTYLPNWLESHNIRVYSNGALIPSISTQGSAFSGEFVSPLLEPKREEYGEWIKGSYPSLMNQTCGLHVHASFKSLYQYHLTTTREYFDGVYFALEAWGRENGIKNKEFWKRLKGENSFCKREFMPDQQVWYKDKEGKRYCGLNYAYSRYKTVELRVLPMFKDYTLAIGAIETFVKFTDSFLLSSCNKQKLQEAIFEPLNDLFKKEVEILLSSSEKINLPETVILNLNPTTSKMKSKPANFLRTHVKELKQRKEVS